MPEHFHSHALWPLTYSRLSGEGGIPPHTEPIQNDDPWRTAHTLTRIHNRIGGLSRAL